MSLTRRGIRRKASLLFYDGAGDVVGHVMVVFHAEQGEPRDATKNAARCIVGPMLKFMDGWPVGAVVCELRISLADGVIAEYRLPPRFPAIEPRPKDRVPPFRDAVL